MWFTNFSLWNLKLKGSFRKYSINAPESFASKADSSLHHWILPSTSPLHSRLPQSVPKGTMLSFPWAFICPVVLKEIICSPFSWWALFLQVLTSTFPRTHTMAPPSQHPLPRAPSWDLCKSTVYLSYHYIPTQCLAHRAHSGDIKNTLAESETAFYPGK